jgi:general secretion pathway protein D
MVTRIHKSWNTAIVVGILLVGGLSSAAWTPQETQKPPVAREIREEAERIRQMLQERQKAGKQKPAEQPQPSESQEPEAPPAPAAAPQPPLPAATASIQQGNGKVRLNYENADLYDFINQIATTLGITPIVIDPDIRGTVNILSTAPMSRGDIFPLFSLILKNNNAALIEESGIYQIVPISSALKRGIDIIEELPESAPRETPKRKLDLPPSTEGVISPSLMEAFKTMKAEQLGAAKTPAATSTREQQTEDSGVPRLATHVMRVEFIPVKDLIEPIKLFMTEGGAIMPYERLNMLILTDYTDSVSRIRQIVRMLDNEYLNPDLIDLVKIENNASIDVAEDLKKIFGLGSEGSSGISFVSIDRLNAIFVMASSKRGLAEVKRWISELDTASGRNIQTHVYVVQNSTASSIAMMLAALYGGEEFSASAQENNGSAQGGAGAVGGLGSQGAFGGSGSTNYNMNQMGTANTPFGSQGYSGGQSYGMGGFGAFGTGQQLGPQLNVRRSVTSRILQGGEFTGLQDTVRMVVDDINNSLIIQATSADYAYILETIKKMDVLPRQVLIDARIFEVDLNNDLNYGVNSILQGRTDEPADHLTGGSIDSNGLSANTFAFVGDSREILMRLNALRVKTKVRILEAPSVLALDGTQASIVVGSEYPYPGGSYYSSTGGSTTSVGYRSTGITLLVEPRISASGSVTLNITQEVSTPGAPVPIGDTEKAVQFSLSRVMTSLSVKDGETVAIAGLIRDSDNVSRSGVPFLSEIPVLGGLFGQTSKGSRRSELIILITPHVIRTMDASQEMTQELRDSLRNVRKYADEKEKEHIEDMEDAREDRYKREEEILNDRKKSLSKKPE